RDRHGRHRGPDRRCQRARLSHHHDAPVGPDLGDRRDDDPVHDPHHPPHRLGRRGVDAARPAPGDDRRAGDGDDRLRAGLAQHRSGLVALSEPLGLRRVDRAVELRGRGRRPGGAGDLRAAAGRLGPGADSAIEGDPIGALITILPLWALIPFWIVAVLTLVSGAVLGIYSSGLTLISLGIRIPRPAAAAVDGLILTAGTIWVAFFATSFIGPFQSFLITLGVPIAAWAGILIADVLSRRADYDEQALFDP